jgi:hypothetical protein
VLCIELEAELLRVEIDGAADVPDLVGNQGIDDARLLDDDEGVDGVACGPAL